MDMFTLQYIDAMIHKYMISGMAIYVLLPLIRAGIVGLLNYMFIQLVASRITRAARDQDDKANGE